MSSCQPLTRMISYMLGMSCLALTWWYLFLLCCSGFVPLSVQPLRERGGHFWWPQARAELQADRVNDCWSCFFFFLSRIRTVSARTPPVRGCTRLFLGLMVLCVWSELSAVLFSLERVRRVVIVGPCGTGFWLGSISCRSERTRAVMSDAISSS